jgi:hypothetical protein
VRCTCGFKLNLKCVDVPIRYAARTYGSTQISRFRHGAMLLRILQGQGTVAAERSTRPGSRPRIME